jgi:hypothetical protein
VDKKLVYIASSIGTAIGAYIPMIFGASGLSMWSILSGGVGGILAIVLVYQLSR